MKERQEMQETYADLLNETKDPALVQLIQRLDEVANEPRLPLRLNWATFNALYNKKSGSITNLAPKIINVKQRQLRRYGLSLIAAILVIGLVIFATNPIWRNVIRGRSSDVHMQLA